jgi:hypothetical protein
MENSKLLNEISRLRELMGVKTIINEQGAVVKLIQNLLRTTASNADVVFDDIADLLVAQGKVTRAQADEAITLLKNNTDLVDNIRTKYTLDNFKKGVVTLADDLVISNKIDDILKSSGSESAEKFAAAMKNIPESQVQKITLGVISKLFKEGALPNAQAAYDNVLAFWKRQLKDNLTNDDVILNLSDFRSSQKMWAYEYCNRALLADSTEFTDNMAEEFIDLFDNRLMNDTEIKELIEKYRLAGKIDNTPGVINPPKLREPLDFPEQLSDTGSKKNPFKPLPADLRNFGKNITNTLQTKYGKLYTFYINTFRPNFRAWLVTPEAAFYKLQNLARGGNLTQEFALYTAKFEEAFNIGFSKFSSGGGKKISRQYINEIKDKLLKLKNAKTPLNPADNFDMELKDLWDTYVRNAKSQLSGVELEQFNQFVKLIEGQESTYFYSSLDELFEVGSKEAGIKPPRSYIDDGLKLEKEIGTKADGVTDQIVAYAFNMVKKHGEKLKSLFLSGTLKTPREVEMYIVKKGFSITSGTKLLAGILFISYVILPTIIGLFEAAWDGMNKNKGLVGREVYSDNPLLNVIGGYVGPRIIDNIMGKGVFDLMFDTGKDREWWQALAVVIPGYADNSVMDLLNLMAGTTKKEGETKEQMLERKLNESGTKTVNERLDKDYKIAVEKDKILKSKGLAPVNVSAITDNKSNYLYLYKSSINGLVTSGDITQKDANFLKTRLKYVPKVPLDFIYLVKEKQKELIKKGAEGLEELEGLNISFGKFDVNDPKFIPKTDVGSIVLVSKSGTEYLVLPANRKHPSITPSLFSKIKDEGEIVWVSPKFTELDTSTDREYNNISTFVKNYNTL